MTDGETPGGALPSAQLLLEARTIAYRCRTSRRARHISASIRPDTGLVVTVPVGAAAPAVETFLRTHQRWILRHIDRLAAIARRVPARWPYGPALPYRGEEHRIILEEARAASVSCESGASLRVRMRRPGLEGARRLLRRWFIDEAARLLPERAETLGRLAGVGWRRLSIRDQRWRWGSCSARGDLNLNFRLVMVPPATMDYVLIHELMHRRELNHSRRFWAHVAARCPEYRDHVAWLRTYGPYLGL
jgi:predicted metal-dependent hydrolase